MTKVRWNRRGGRYEGEPDVEFAGITVREVDFSHLVFDDFRADGTIFVDCDFSGASITGSLGVRKQTRFQDCTFDETKMAHADPGQSRFLRCVFRSVDVRGWSAEAVEFVDCRFAGEITRCNFWGAPWGAWLEPDNLRPRRRVNEFHGNDFREARLFDVAFLGGVDIGAQSWPESPDYIRLDRLHDRVAAVRPMVEKWTDAVARQEAILMLDLHSEGGYDRQDELFANRWDLGVPRPVAERVWKLLEDAK